MPTQPTNLSIVSPATATASFDAGARERNPPQPAPSAPDLRLIIEEGPKRGTFIYKTVDRVTGETQRQFPREELVRLKEDPAYAAGAVTDTKA